jgi:hypothetical protein
MNLCQHLRRVLGTQEGEGKNLLHTLKIRELMCLQPQIWIQRQAALQEISNQIDGRLQVSHGEPGYWIGRPEGRGEVMMWAGTSAVARVVNLLLPEVLIGACLLCT